MTSSPTPPPAPRRPILPRWVGLLFPAVLLAAVAAWLAFVANQTVLPFILALAFSAGLGLLSGFCSRWLLAGRPFLVRAPAAVAAVTVSLLLLGLLTGGAAGIGLTETNSFNGLGLFHLSVGILTALMALSAWRAPGRAPAPTRTPSATAPRPRPASPLAAAWQNWTGRWDGFRDDTADKWRQSGLYRGLNRSSAWLGGLRNRIHLPQTGRVNAPAVTSSPAPVSTARASIPPAPAAQPPAGPSVRERVAALGRSALRWRRPSTVRMGKVAEQRCPYCFDVVQPNDPRGIVVCSICHTPHHADCWAVTGMCQIPHSHN